MYLYRFLYGRGAFKESNYDGGTGGLMRRVFKPEDQWENGIGHAPPRPPPPRVFRSCYKEPNVTLFVATLLDCCESV